LSERNPRAEAEILIRKAKDDANAMCLLAVPLRYDEILDTEPIDRQATLALVNDVGNWAATQLPPNSD
jgi:hypothetical protein